MAGMTNRYVDVDKLAYHNARLASAADRVRRMTELSGGHGYDETGYCHVHRQRCPQPKGNRT